MVKMPPTNPGDFFFAKEIIIDLGSVLVQSGLVASKRELKRLHEQNQKVFLLIQNLTPNKMQFESILGTFAVEVGEEIMLGNNFLKRIIITADMALDWPTEGFI